ncbi:LysR family transcriptional regulator [Streptomyces tateyamensis]|uniref:LysR family transcriptional regulator n=1 Tax=Streptomyces tateyamensis TaxID=565073 RepID=A0A2V4NCI0_9ACTN|nr:LysR family transcriptional regulator [Streptomyces tateyamensis]PYC77818.1 LysR family transcriptional regulator [Streptomyces tateyamensis]
MALVGTSGALELRHLRSFLMVAQEQNITRAAARLHLAQQAVSVQIQQLERALGTELLVRGSRGVTLTAAGLELAAGVRSVVGELDSLTERVRSRAEQAVPAPAPPPHPRIQESARRRPGTSRAATGRPSSAKAS